MDGPAKTQFEPGERLENGLYVGLHRYDEKDPCPLQLAWNLCRNYAWGDVEYDDQLYIVKIRIHREGRGGKPFAPDLSIRSTRTATLGMAESEFVKKNSAPIRIRFVDDPEFGPLKIVSYHDVEYELEMSNNGRIVAAITLL